MHYASVVSFRNSAYNSAEVLSTPPKKRKKAKEMSGLIIVLLKLRNKDILLDYSLSNLKLWNWTIGIANDSIFTFVLHYNSDLSIQPLAECIIEGVSFHFELADHHVHLSEYVPEAIRKEQSMP